MAHNAWKSSGTTLAVYAEAAEFFSVKLGLEGLFIDTTWLELTLLSFGC
jgi:hypothetical protein